MANRHTLHINKLDSFKKWLVKDGWTIAEPKGEWEVLRAKKVGRQNPLIVYQRMNKEHLSVMDRDVGVIKAFLRDSKKPQTNADRIRSMTDEELLDFICSIETFDDGIVKIIEDGVAMCSVTEVEEWLRAESEG